MVAAVTGVPARIRCRPHGGPAASRRCERRRPEKTPLHKIISENLESWLAWREAAERPVSGYVEEELRGYLECGRLCFGFARAVCMTCRTGFVVAFSCKSRGVCPSCNGRHMAQTAAHLVDHVIPPVPVRQWVISVPKRLRGMLADRPAAVAALTKIFLDEIERLLCAAAGGTSDAATPASARPRLGGISFLHRFGSALNHHVHLHACVTDGVFVPAADQADCDAPPAFLATRPITQADLAALTERVRRRVIRWFRMQRLLDAAAAAEMLAWEHSGFSIDASVRQLRPYSLQAARFDNSPVKTRRRTSVHISMSAYTPRASLSVGGNRGSAAILLTDTAAQLCAAFFDRPGYPAARCTFRPAFTIGRSKKEEERYRRDRTGSAVVPK